MPLHDVLPGLNPLAHSFMGGRLVRGETLRAGAARMPLLMRGKARQAVRNILAAVVQSSTNILAVRSDGTLGHISGRLVKACESAATTPAGVVPGEVLELGRPRCVPGYITVHQEGWRGAVAAADTDPVTEQSAAAIGREILRMLPPGIAATLEAAGLELGDISRGTCNWLAGATAPDESKAGSERRDDAMVWARDRIEYRERNPIWSDPPISTDGALARRRQQATQSYPLLPFLLAVPDGRQGKSVLGEGEPQDVLPADHIRAAIDAAFPLAPVLEATLGIPPWLARRLVGLRLANIAPGAPGAEARRGRSLVHEIHEVAFRNEKSRLDLHGLVRALATVGPDRAPCSGSEWRAFHTVTTLVDKATFYCGGEILGPIWASVSAPEAVDHEALRRVGLNDVLGDLTRNLVLPFIGIEAPGAEKLVEPEVPRREEAARVACERLLLRGRTLSQVASLNAWWHARHAGIRRRLSAAYPSPIIQEENLVWAPLTADLSTSEGWRVTALTTAADLKAEGEALDHCVGTYADDCGWDRCHIMSVRDSDGRPISTFEVSGEALRGLLEEGRDLEGAVPQHQAQGNTEPPEEAKRAVAEWLAAVTSGALKIGFDALEQALEERIAVRDAAGDGPEAPWNWRDDGPCYDARAVAARDMAWREFSPILPRRIRLAGPRAFAALCAAALAEGTPSQVKFTYQTWPRLTLMDEIVYYMPSNPVSMGLLRSEAFQLGEVPGVDGMAGAGGG